MMLNTTGNETPPNNTTTSNETNNNNTPGNGTTTTKKKKKGNGGNGSTEQDNPKTKFEGLSKEADFKGVVLECGKPAIQTRLMRKACVSHANA